MKLHIPGTRADPRRRDPESYPGGDENSSPKVQNVGVGSSDDLGMRKLPPTAAEDLLEVIMRRYERTSTVLTSNRPVNDWGKLLGDTAAVSALLDRMLHHAHLIKCDPRSWRTQQKKNLQTTEESST